ncbi:MAG: hypothetical protein ACLU9S_16095 [Oscillospiraceae bacterium]
MAAKNAAWAIQKAAGTLALSPDLHDPGRLCQSKSITVTKNGTGRSRPPHRPAAW